MPELPEVERFRQLLEPLVSSSCRLSVALLSTKTPRTFLSESDVKAIDGNCHVADVLRKGKLICMVLDCTRKVRSQKRAHLFMHMGMTGRISAPHFVLGLESLKQDAEHPPPNSCLRFHTDAAECSFSDPRRFGSIRLCTDLAEGFQELAPDALTCNMDNLDGLVSQSMRVKAILLDQHRVVSGVGNWVADEVLYQCRLHPDQKMLSTAEAELLVKTLVSILQAAVDCLENNRKYPEEWLFHCRWLKRSATNGTKIKDFYNQTVAFVTCAGRTCAIVPSVQKLSSRTRKQKTKEKRKTLPQKSTPVKKALRKRRTAKDESRSRAAEKQPRRSRCLLR